jgi:hypothetical protein
MKVATYTRISTDEERQPFSLEAQGRAPAKSRFVPVCPMALRRGPARRDRVDPGWEPASQRLACSDIRCRPRLAGAWRSGRESSRRCYSESHSRSTGLPSLRWQCAPSQFSVVVGQHHPRGT